MKTNKYEYGKTLGVGVKNPTIIPLKNICHLK